jgi:hypothetical protein
VAAWDAQAPGRGYAKPSRGAPQPLRPQWQRAVLPFACAKIAHHSSAPSRSTQAGSPTTRLAAAARSRARTRRMWRRRSMTTTARRARRAPKRVTFGGAAARSASLPSRGQRPSVAPGCATHYMGGGGPAEPGEGKVRGCLEAAESCGLREQASARPHLSAPQLGRRVEAARLLLEGLRGQLVVSRRLVIHLQR